MRIESISDALANEIAKVAEAIRAENDPDTLQIIRRLDDLRAKLAPYRLRIPPLQ